MRWAIHGAYRSRSKMKTTLEFQVIWTSFPRSSLLSLLLLVSTLLYARLRGCCEVVENRSEGCRLIKDEDECRVERLWRLKIDRRWRSKLQSMKWDQGWLELESDECVILEWKSDSPWMDNWRWIYRWFWFWIGNCNSVMIASKLS